MYHVQKIPQDFIENYLKIVEIIILRSTSYRKFFMFLQDNKSYFTKYKDSIGDIIMDKNKKWIEKYILNKV
jgi:hypothetical protein